MYAKAIKTYSQKSDNIQQTQMNFKNNKPFCLKLREWKLQIIRNVQQTSRELLARDFTKQRLENHGSENYLLSQQVASLRRQTFRLRMLGQHLSGNKSLSASNCVHAVKNNAPQISSHMQSQAYTMQWAKYAITWLPQRTPWHLEYKSTSPHVSQKKTSHDTFAWVTHRQQKADPNFHMNVSNLQMTKFPEICSRGEADCCFSYTWISISLERARVPLRQQQADEMKDQVIHNPKNDSIPNKCMRVAHSRHCTYFTTIWKELCIHIYMDLHKYITCRLLVDISMHFHMFGTCKSASQATTDKQNEKSLWKKNSKPNNIWQDTPK